MSHAGPTPPSNSIALLIRPSDGCIKILKVMPTATMLTITGKNTIDLRTVLSRIMEVKRTASEEAEDDLQATGDHRIDQCVAHAADQCGRLKKRTKLSRPMNSQSNNDQRVRLKKKAIPVGTMNKTA